MAAKTFTKGNKMNNLIDKYSKEVKRVINPITENRTKLFDDNFTPIDILSEYRAAMVLLRENKQKLEKACSESNRLRIEHEEILVVIDKIKLSLEFRIAEGVINDD